MPGKEFTARCDGCRHCAWIAPNGQQWRTEQLRNLDNDYEAWRGERYKKFSDEFNTWRSNRPSQGSSQSTQQGSATNKAKDKDQS